MRDLALGKRILLIGGSLNQTTMMHAVGRHLAAHRCSYTPYYGDGIVRWASRKGYLDRTVLGGAMRRQTVEYLTQEQLHVDEGGQHGPYDLVVTGSDLLVQRNVRGRPLVLIQEGMTDPETVGFRLVQKFGLPRWIASTAATGLSLAYSRFCVASDGFRDLFMGRGVPADRMIVTGIPNYDNCASYLRNAFPLRGYVLVATSDTRETLKRDDRAKFFARVREIARDRPIVVKLHPNENAARSIAEINVALPGARVFHDGNAHHMVANCDVLITQWSTLVFDGLALNKECHSSFDMHELRRLCPIQNAGTSAAHIARVCEQILQLDAGARTGRAILEEAS
ncbi:MAG: hypothetical protein ABJF01_06940 [bacterium]